MHWVTAVGAAKHVLSNLRITLSSFSPPPLFSPCFRYGSCLSFLFHRTRGVKNPTFQKVWSLVSSDTPTIKTSAWGEVETSSKRSKVKFQGIPYRPSEAHVISLCAYRGCLTRWEFWQTASKFSNYWDSFKHNDIPGHVGHHTVCSNWLKHNDVSSHVGPNTACQVFAISKCELTCLVAWP